MKQGPTIFLRIALIALGLMVLGLCALVLPEIYTGWPEAHPEVAWMGYPFMAVLIATTIPFFIALNQAFKLLQCVDKNQVFSAYSTKALKNIQYCALSISALYTWALPAVFQIAEQDDAPGLILVFGAIFIGAPLVAAVAVGVMGQLLQNAVKLKSENDLTV